MSPAFIWINTVLANSLQLGVCFIRVFSPSLDGSVRLIYIPDCIDCSLLLLASFTFLYRIAGFLRGSFFTNCCNPIFMNCQEHLAPSGFSTTVVDYLINILYIYYCSDFVHTQK